MTFTAFVLAAVGVGYTARAITRFILWLDKSGQSETERSAADV